MAGSPWGAIQHSQILKRGMRLVSTCGHGGVMVTLKAAEKYLSVEARKRGEKYGNYLCYEEDCEMAIPMYENPDLWNAIDEDIKEVEKRFLRSLSLWNGDYLIARGIEPIKEEYDIYLKHKERDRLLFEKSPDLITAAQSREGYDDVVTVYTADGQRHFVDKNSYRELDRTLRLLSKCKLVVFECLEL